MRSGTARRLEVTGSVGSSDVEEDTLFGFGHKRRGIGGRIGIAVIEEMP